jgi:hypothetical protein
MGEVPIGKLGHTDQQQNIGYADDDPEGYQGISGNVDHDAGTSTISSNVTR